jgi:uncharacterized secreted protein with C-terminal beta-propeller domain
MRVLLIFSIPFILSAYSTVKLQKGWNLVGFSEERSVEKLKTEYPQFGNIYLWKSGDWVKNSGTISPTDGVWIYSEIDTDIYSIGNEVYSENISNIDLEKGWNLLSLPIQSAVSPDIFKDEASVWKYSGGEWSFYQKDGSKSDVYPDLNLIGNGEGFWVLSDSNKSIDISAEGSKLRNFETNASMMDFLTSMVRYNGNTRSDDYYYWAYATDDNMAVPEADESVDVGTVDVGTADSSTKVSDTTSTNTQEVDVDEADIVKHDGENIFYLSGDWSETEIFITSFDEVLKGNSEPITTIETTKRPEELYLIGDKLIVIYPYNNSFWSSWCYVDYDLWSNKSLVEVYDVSDISNISKVESFEFDGNIVDTRVTGGKLFVISRYMPYIKISYEKTYISCDEYCYYPEDENGYFKTDYNNYTEISSHFIPTLNGKPLFSHETLYAPRKVDQTPFITSITSFDISDFSKIDSVSAIGNSETIYASTEAIYIVSQDYPKYWNWRDYDERVAIYKFDISDTLSYSGRAFVDGRILNQFSLSEYKDTLRVATTQGWRWWGDSRKDGTDNIVTALQEKSGTLEVVGEVRGLGNPNEEIKGVRFFGDRGYIVTFLNTDPLYVVDFSNPAEPVLGENPLKIDGYSTYFHSVSDSLILSLGVNANSDGRETGYQIQLFNILDLDNPALIDKMLIPATQDTDTRWRYYSEAIHNHKSFVYRNSDNLFGLGLRETVDWSMDTEEKKKYIAENYIPISEANLSDEVLKEYELEIELGTPLYIHKSYLGSLYPYVVSTQDIYFPSYFYKNDLKIYQVVDNEIVFKNDISGGENSDYGYQRGIIFTYDNRNYAIYFLGGEFYLGEINN